MKPENTLITDPLANLSYFVEWGGKQWEFLLRYAIQQFVGIENFNNIELLDIGTRYGKMAILFAILGANVTGIDLHELPLRLAEEQARKFHIAEKIKFVSYNGDLDIFPDESFDIVFTKSVLVVVPALKTFLQQISPKLKPEGKIIFIENGHGNFIIHSLRRLKHRGWNYDNVNFFTEKQLALFRELFEITEIKKSFIPPIYLILGYKK